MSEKLLLDLIKALIKSDGKQENSEKDRTFHTPKTTVTQDKGWNIIVLDRGWVAVAIVTVVGDTVFMKSGYHIRVWGTSKGLGELINGPLLNTKLDYFGSAETHVLCVNHMIKVEDTKWAGHKKT